VIFVTACFEKTIMITIDHNNKYYYGSTVYVSASSAPHYSEHYYLREEHSVGDSDRQKHERKRRADARGP
jgi:hypothetical protein